MLWPWVGDYYPLIRGFKTQQELRSVIDGATSPALDGNYATSVSSNAAGCVIVLEEFDKALLALKAQSILKQEKDDYQNLKTLNVPAKKKQLMV